MGRSARRATVDGTTCETAAVCATAEDEIDEMLMHVDSARTRAVSMERNNRATLRRFARYPRAEHCVSAAGPATDRACAASRTRPPSTSAAPCDRADVDDPPVPPVTCESAARSRLGGWFGHAGARAPRAPTASARCARNLELRPGASRSRREALQVTYSRIFSVTTAVDDAAWLRHTRPRPTCRAASARRATATTGDRLRGYPT